VAQAAPVHPPLPALSLTGFDRACGAAVDSRGDVYVASAGESKIRVFDSQHNLLASIENTNVPCGLAVDSKGNLYVSETKTGTVIRYAPNVYPLSGTPTYGSPTTVDASGQAKGIAVDPVDDRLYVARGTAIAVYTSTGIPDATVGTGNLTEATGVAAYTYEGGDHARYVFAADGSGDVIKVFGGTSVASLSLRWTIDGSDEDALKADKTPDNGFGFGPAGAQLEVDRANGHVFVFDAEHHVVDEFEAAGAYVTQVAGAGFDDAEPTAVAVRPRRDEVQELETSTTGGSFSLSFEGTESDPLPYSATAAQIQSSLEEFPMIGMGNVVVSGAYVAEVQRGDYQILFVNSLGGKDIDGEIQADASGLTGGNATATTVVSRQGFGPGRVYVSSGSSADAELLAFGPLAVPSRPPREDLSFKIPGTSAVAVDSHGDRYVNSGTTIHVYDPDGKEIKVGPSGKGIVDQSAKGAITDLAVDSSGKVYAIDGNIGSSNEGRAVYLTPDSFPPVDGTKYSEANVVATTATFGTSVPLRALGLNPANGHLFVATQSRIIEFDSAANQSKVLDPDFGTSLGIAAVTDVDVYGANGDVYIVDQPSGRIVIADPSGEHVLARVDGAGSREGRFSGTEAERVTVNQSNGHLLAFSPTRTLAEEYEPSGSFVAEFGSFVSTSNRAGIAIDSSGSTSDGNVFVAYFGELSAFGPLAYGEPPIAATAFASAVAAGDATLNGTVDPRGFSLSDCQFEYLGEVEYLQNLEDEDPAFEGADEKGCAESSGEIGKGTKPVAVHATLSGLDPDGRYRFRLLAENEYGASGGTVGIFGPPLLVTEAPRPISYTEVIARATIDPSGLASEYHVEYGTSDSYGQGTAKTQLSPGSAPADVSIPIFGLAEGTPYHLRVVVENEAKTVFGPDQTFQTRVRRNEGCPNTEFRTGLSAGLPDCRAYELVTPADTRGLTPYATQLAGLGHGHPFNNWLTVPRGSAAGERLSYYTDGTLLGFNGSGRRDGYRAQRGADGWQSELSSPSHRQAGGGLPSNIGVASDQEHSLWSVNPTEPIAGTLPAGEYLRGAGGFEALGRGSLGTDLNAQSWYLGDQRAIFASSAQLEPEAPPPGTEALYGRTLASPSSEVLSLLPGAIPAGNAEYIGATEDAASVVFSSADRLYVRNAGAQIIGVPNALVGESLSCAAGPATAARGYQWLRNGTPIPAATDPNYTTVAADTGALLQCQVQATAIGGASLSTSSPLPLAPFPSIAPPAAIHQPTLSGTAEAGQTLSCDQGSWDGNPTFSYQWYRDGAPIAASTASTYLLAEADKDTAVQCGLSASSPGGAVLAYTAPKLVGPMAPKVSARPAISGISAPGETLSCANGTWADSPSAFAYQWLRNGTPIAAATAGTYAVAGADEGTALQCRVTASNAAAAAAAVSAAVVVAPAPIMAPPAPSGVATVSGIVAVGQTLTCDAGVWSGGPAFAYQWLRNGTPIASATTDTYALVAGDRKATIACQVTASNAGGAVVAIADVTTDPPVASADVPAGLTFAGISNDGNRLFYVGAGVGGPTPAPARIFALDLDTEITTKIADESRFVNVSADGSHVYFTSKAVLDDEGEGKAGEDNLYLWDQGGGATRFIAVLDPEDVAAHGFEGFNDNLIRWPAAVGPGSSDVGRAYSLTRSTPKGDILVFASHGSLTPYDSDGHSEIYRYDAEAQGGQGELGCVSCDPSGVPANGAATLQSLRDPRLVSPTTVIPNLTDDGGSVFFESLDSLLPEDANSVQDVYEWTAEGAGNCELALGCLALISSGQGEHASYLYSMSADGHDVFFETPEKLVGADQPGSPSIYDARVEGGIPDPVAPAPCQGDACQGDGSALPALPVPASTGPGEGTSASPPRCSKSKHRVKGRCVKKHKGKHRRADHDRRTHR
jgi:hypothetical protein